MKLAKFFKSWLRALTMTLGLVFWVIHFSAQAQSWTVLTNSPFACINFVCSSDGRIIYTLTDETGNLRQSTNYGATWTRQLTNSGFPVSCSADGTKVAVGSSLVSTNSGQSFTQTSSSGDLLWSADGNMLIAVGNGLGISANSGATWTTSLQVSGLQYGALSANGTVIVAASQQSIYVSTNSGLSWSNAISLDTYSGWTALACTASGGTIVAAAITNDDPHVFVSQDRGITWRDKLPIFYSDLDPRYFANIVTSADGSLLIGDTMFDLYISRDLGSTWILDTTPFQQSSQPAACTADGTMIISSSNTFATVQYLPPPLVIKPSATQLNLSWPAPSSQYALQQASDLTSTNWIPVTNPITVTNYRNTVTVSPPASGNAFYRLLGPN